MTVRALSLIWMILNEKIQKTSLIDGLIQVLFEEIINMTFDFCQNVGIQNEINILELSSN